MGNPAVRLPKPDMRRLRESLNRVGYAHLAIIQGLYYVLGGLWPMVSMSTFLAVTGPKTDLWLVNTVGLLLALIGGVLMVAGIRWKVSMEILLLAVGSAAVIAGVEIVYVSLGRISPIYLLDSVLQLALMALWLSIRVRGRGSSECGSLYDPSLSRPNSGSRS